MANYKIGFYTKDCFKNDSIDIMVNENTIGQIRFDLTNKQIVLEFYAHDHSIFDYISYTDDADGMEVQMWGIISRMIFAFTNAPFSEAATYSIPARADIQDRFSKFGEYIEKQLELEKEN